MPYLKHYFTDFQADSPIAEVSNAMYDKSLRFILTHDVEVRLPNMMFDSATFKISPRYFEGNGLIAKLEIVPKLDLELPQKATPRIFFKKISMVFISQFINYFFFFCLIKLFSINNLLLITFRETCSKKAVTCFGWFNFDHQNNKN